MLNGRSFISRESPCSLDTSHSAQARDIGLQTSWSPDVLGSFNSSVTWSEALKQTAYRAEFEHKTTHSAGREEHVLARLQRDHALTQAELQASRRCAAQT